MKANTPEYNEYMRLYMARRYEKRKSELIALLGGQCVGCGSADDLQFDHVDRARKSFTIGSRLAGCAEAKLLREIRKCQLLCPRCHELKTLRDLGRQSGKTTHGTVSSYRYCKCELCREAVRKYNRERNRKRRT